MGNKQHIGKRIFLLKGLRCRVGGGFPDRRHMCTLSLTVSIYLPGPVFSHGQVVCCCLDPLLEKIIKSLPNGIRIIILSIEVLDKHNL